MKKLLSIIALGAALASCGAPTEQSLPTSTPADEYFFPTSNGTQFVYSEGTLTVTDTTTYQVVIGGAYDYSRLAKKDTSISSDVLYYYKVDQSNTGLQQCILSQTGSDQGFIALQGDLKIGSQWFADQSSTIEATVVGRYADYFLPGSQQQAVHDVIAVKYVDKTKSDGSYVVRFFARDLGLILERTVHDATQEISNLQLLSKIAPPSNGPGAPDDHDHWYDQRGRYIMQWKIDDIETK